MEFSLSWLLVGVVIVVSRQQWLVKMKRVEICERKNQRQNNVILRKQKHLFNGQRKKANRIKRQNHFFLCVFSSSLLLFQHSARFRCQSNIKRQKFLFFYSTFALHFEANASLCFYCRSKKRENRYIFSFCEKIKKRTAKKFQSVRCTLITIARRSHTKCDDKVIASI